MAQILVPKKHRGKNTQKPCVLILIIKSRSNFLSEMSKMSVGNDHFINEQQTFVPDTHRDAGISGKFRRIFGWQSSNRYTHLALPPLSPANCRGNFPAFTAAASVWFRHTSTITWEIKKPNTRPQTPEKGGVRGGGLSRGTGETRWVRFRGMFRRFAFAGARLFATGSSTREIGLFHKRFASSLLFPSTYYSKRAPCFFF